MLDQSIKLIKALALGLVSAAALLGPSQSGLAQSSTAPLQLKADAPDRYVVVPGDTLWGIAARYTDSPWRWHELWDLNKAQITDPHRIYPGNIIVLDRAQSRLSMAKTVRLSPRVRVDGTTRAAIPSIPAAVIEPFLTRPLVVEADGLDKAPAIVAGQENRVILASGNRAYVSGIGDSTEKNWYIYRRGQPLVDPDTTQTLGYEALYLGSARVLRGGDPATMEIVTAVQEIAKGDHMIAVGKPEVVNYAPHAPKVFVKGRVINIYGGLRDVGETGRQGIISLNRGKSDGIEVGHVLALHRLGGKLAAGTNATVTVPDERYGLVFVFRVFDRVSYAMVMDVSRPVQASDVVQTP